MNRLPLHLKTIFWIIAAIAVGLVSASIVLRTAGYEKVSRSPAESYQATDTGLIGIAETSHESYFIKDGKKAPKISAEAYFVGDLDSGQVILQKNGDKVFPIASVSKLMTAAVAEDSEVQGATTTITARVFATEGENGGLHTNEKIRVGDLIYPLILESSNDAAEALAANLGRGDFVSLMNEKARQLGLASTSFADPTGLSEKNVSTASDLFKFSQYLKSQKPNLLAISTKRSYGTKTHTWFNISQFLGDDGYVGGKRGYINESKQTALAVYTVPLAQVGTRNIAIEILRSDDRYKDVENLLAFIKKNVYYGVVADASAPWVKEKEAIPEPPPEPDFVTMLFGGDIMLDRGVRNSVNKNFNGDYSLLFQNLALFKKQDIVFANLEGTASDQGADMHNLYSFRMDPSVVPALKGAGISILSVANNHVGDWGIDAYTDTLARLRENEILYTGGGDNKATAEQPTIIQKYGMKIGFLGFSDKGPDWMAAMDEKAGILSASDPGFDTIVANAAKQVDYLIVSFHFGEEYQTAHNARQAELAHRAIEDGAKIIIGAHPHVVEDFEKYKNGYIAYSVGNLMFDQNFSQNTMQGMLLGIKLFKDGHLVVNKNIVQLNRAFQPEKVIVGKDENIIFAAQKTQ